MQSAGLDESQVGIKIAGRNLNNLRYADDTILMSEIEEKLKSYLMRVKKKLAWSSTLKKLRSWHPVPSLQGKLKKRTQWKILFSWSPKSLKVVAIAMELKDACSLEEKVW